MRVIHLAYAGFAGLLAFPLFVFACSSTVANAPITPDAAAADALQQADTGPVEVGPLPDAVMQHCTLDNGGLPGAAPDPVAFCIQKLALQSLHFAAFAPASGVASSWDSVTGAPDTSDAGAVLHDWHDDVGYAAACALYHASAVLYGDNEFTSTLDADLQAIAPLVERELAPLPAEYEGEAYQRLRVAAGGLLVLNDNTNGPAFHSLADAYGRAIFTSYFFSLSGSQDDGGMSDAAAEAGPLGDGGGDAGPTDAGGQAADGGLMVADGIIGRPSNGGYAYVSADVATAAYALLDLAVRNPTDPNQSRWQLAALSAIEHIHRRARDATTGLYYTALITSGDPGHDTLDPSNPTSGGLLTNTAATIALALSRAQDLANKNVAALLPAVQSYPFNTYANEIIVNVNGTPSLYDGPINDDAGDVSSTGFMEGYSSSSLALITTKATRDNAYLIAAIHRQEVQSSTPYSAGEVAPLFLTLTNLAPANSSLLSVIPDQNAYLRATSQKFSFVGGDAGTGEPFARSYRSAAVIAFVEGMSELLFGRQQ